MKQPLLQVRDLSVTRITQAGQPLPVIRGITFSIVRGESVGLLGESGSGKSTLAHSLLGLLPPESSEIRGSIQVDARELNTQGEKEMQQIRGARISLVFQEPALALNPVLCARTGSATEKSAAKRRNSRSN